MKMKCLLRPLLASATALALFVAPSAFADTAYWNLNGTGNFTDTANWTLNSNGTGGAPGTAPVGLTQNANFNTSVNNNNITANFSVAQQLQGFVFNNTGTTTIANTSGSPKILTLGGGGILINSGAGVVNIGAATSATAIRYILNTSQTWTNNSSNTFTLVTQSNINLLSSVLTTTGSGDIALNGALNSTGGVIKNGANTLTLGGVNSFSGGIVLNSGTLSLGSNTTLGAAASALTINGGTVDVTAARTTTNNNAQNWNGNFAFGGTNTWNTGTGAVTMNGSRTVTVTASTMTVGGNIAGVGFGLTKAGAGTLTLNGTNTYNGGTTVNAGTLRANRAAALPNVATGTISVNNAGSVLSLSTGNATLDNWTSAQVDSLLANGNVTFGTGTSLGFDTNEVNFSYNTNITKANMGLVKSGSTRLILGGNNTYSGNTTVTGGIIQANSDSAYGTGTVIFNGGLWGGLGNRTISNNIIYAVNSSPNNFAGTNVTNFTGQTSGAGNASVNGFEGGIVRFSGNNSGWTGNWKFNGPITLQLNHIDAMGSGTTITFNTNDAENAARGTLGSQVALTGVNAITQDIDLGGTLAFTGNSTIRTTADMEVTGDVTGGLNGALVKDGAGTLTLGGTNNYSGTTTVSAGTLLINGDSTLATGTVTVSTGATLGGSGTIGGALSVSGTLAPGNSPANLTVNNNITLEDTSTVAFELNGTTVGTQYDRITMTGASSVLALTGINNLTLSLGFTPAINNMFFLVDNQGSSAISGVFEQLNGVTTTLTQGSQFNVGGSFFEISYIGDLGTNSFTGGNDLVILTVVPEPSTIAVLALLVVCLGLHRFRKTRSA